MSGLAWLVMACAGMEMDVADFVGAPFHRDHAPCKSFPGISIPDNSFSTHCHRVQAEDVSVHWTISSTWERAASALLHFVTNKCPNYVRLYSTCDLATFIADHSCSAHNAGTSPIFLVLVLLSQWSVSMPWSTAEPPPRDRTIVPNKSHIAVFSSIGHSLSQRKVRQTLFDANIKPSDFTLFHSKVNRAKTHGNGNKYSKDLCLNRRTSLLASQKRLEKSS